MLRNSFKVPGSKFNVPSVPNLELGTLNLERAAIKPNRSNASFFSIPPFKKAAID